MSKLNGTQVLLIGLLIAIVIYGALSYVDPSLVRPTTLTPVATATQSH